MSSQEEMPQEETLFPRLPHELSVPLLSALEQETASSPGSPSELLRAMLSAFGPCEIFW